MIEEILSNQLNGEPIHDAVIIGVNIIIVLIFYEIMFSAMFSIFKKN